jgi:aminoglycoside phosphotransferase (APT) family kinase protein
MILPDAPMHPPSGDADLQTRLREYLAAGTGKAVAVSPPVRLSGGASRESWAVDAQVGAEAMSLVVRLDPPGAPVQGGTRSETRLLRLAAEHGVPVPRVLWAEESDRALGGPFLVMERIEGETIPRKLLRDAVFAEARRRMVGQCATALAQIHGLPVESVDVLGPGRSPHQLLGEQRALLDRLGEPHPVFELALRWLEPRAPESTRTALVHGDFRTGNLIVGSDGLRAIIDWELAHLGDPAEDLGWFCVRSWRFGNDGLPAGGFGSRDELLAAYTAAGGVTIDAATLHYWEVYGNLRWGIICVLQAHTHLSGAVRSLELAAIGRRACEMEYDLLELIGDDMATARPG